MDNKTRPTFITLRAAVDLISVVSGQSPCGAAASLADTLNDAVGQSRPALFEMDGPARKVVADPDGRYGAVILALDALKHEPPAEGFSNHYAAALHTMRSRADGRSLPTERERYNMDIAVLDRVQVRAVEFEGFAGIELQVTSTSESTAARHDSVAVRGGVTKHRTKSRTHPLDGVIAAARIRAVRDDWKTVWGELCSMAEAANRPAPLLGYSPMDGLKYRAETDEGFKYHREEAFRKRWPSAGNGRTRTPAEAGG
jgi:hypothetical protein